MHICVSAYIKMCMYIHARMGVHMLIYALFVYLYCQIPLLRVYHRYFLTPAYMHGRGLEVGFYFGLFMVSACSWYGRLEFKRGSNWTAGFDDLLMIWTHRLFFF